jgi:low temperature requirement protein LtrA
MPGVRLLTADGHHRDERHATALELFFDLVFAAAISQLASALAAHTTAAGFARFAGLFGVVWWVWVTFTVYADRFGTCQPVHRLALLLAMLLTVGLAASVPGAFDGHTTPLVIAYVLLKGEQLVLFGWVRRQVPAVRRLYGWHLLIGLFSLACWAASLASAGSARYALWGVAILAEMVTPWLVAGPARAAPLNISHLPERFATLLLIVLGESVARLVGAGAQRAWSIQLCVVLAAAFGSIAAMWWISFKAVDHAAPSLGRRATLAYMYLQLPMVAGIAAASAGLRHAILAADGAGPLDAGLRAAIYGGVALFLLAAALMPAGGTRAGAGRVRLAAAFAAATLVIVGAIVPPVCQVAALTIVLVAEIAVELPHGRDKPTTAPSPAPLTDRERSSVHDRTVAAPGPAT